MRRPQYWGILLVALGTTGCATSAHRTTSDRLTSQPGLWAKPGGPQQTQVSLPPEQPDLFSANTATSEHKMLSRYFPGLVRQPMAAKSSAKATTTPAAPEATFTPAVAATTPQADGRPSLFGFRRSTAPKSYTTDARSLAARSNVEPAILPVALHLPGGQQADGAVTPTSVDLPEAKDAPTPEPAPHDPVPANPDASSATTEPLSTSEPLLAIDPVGAKAKSATPPAPDVAPEPAATPAADAAPDTPAVDPRERPRLSANTTEIPGPTDPADDKPSARSPGRIPTRRWCATSSP